jgi:hypothetical protein
MSTARANGSPQLKTTTQYPTLTSRIKGTPPPLADHWLDTSAPKAVLFTIGPEMAVTILAERNPHNRKLSAALVRKLSAALRRGEWRVNGETVVFDREGNLKNGQHRLTACVETGIALETWVVFGVDPACFSTMDRGKNRDTADDLSIGHEKNTHTLAATLAMVWREENGGAWRIDLHPSSDQLQDVLRRHPGIRDAANWVAAKSIVKLLTPRIGGYCFYRFAALDPAEAVRFFDDLRLGIGLEGGDPVLLLRNRLIENKTAKTRLKMDEVIALVTKAWNIRRSGRRVRNLSWRGTGPTAEPFPTPA